MQTAYFIIFTLLGFIVGSFLNVCIDRLPQQQSIVTPPSHCPACRKRLAFTDLIPVFSYLWLRGRCRFCHAPIPRRILWVEVITGALFALLFWRFGLTAQLPIVLIYTSIFLALFFIDLEQGLLLNILVYPTMGFALLIASITLFMPQPETIIIAPSFIPDTWILSAILGGAIGFVLFLLIVIISRGGMGWGDVKMAGLIGLVTGYPLVFVAILLSILTGGIVAIILLILKLRGRKQAIPFGPFLALGAIVTMVFGGEILDWYLRPWF